MANVTATGYKTLGRGFSNELQYAKLVYNFSADGGASADAYRLGITDGKIMVVHSRVHVETAFTSGGSATVIIGVEGGDTDAFLDLTSGAVASLTDDSVHQETAGQGLVIADGAYISADVGTADLTAGKLTLHLWYVNVD